MKAIKDNLTPLAIIILTAALYRAMPGRVWGFAPHIALAIFGGAVFTDKRLSFVFPLISLLVSDLVYHLLYINGLFEIPGFYQGQFTNYLLIGSLAFIGFFIRKDNILHVCSGALAGPITYFLASNFLVWLNGGGFSRPKTISGLLQCYADGLPFLQTSIAGTAFFSALLFGGLWAFSRMRRQALA